MDGVEGFVEGSGGDRAAELLGSAVLEVVGLVDDEVTVRRQGAAASRDVRQ